MGAAPTALPVTFNDPALRLEALLSVPPVIVRSLTVETPPKLNVPPETATAPVVPALSAPLNVAVPLPDTVSVPSSEMGPLAVKAPALMLTPPARVEVVALPLSVNAPPEIARPVLDAVVNPLMLAVPL